MLPSGSGQRSIVTRGLARGHVPRDPIQRRPHESPLLGVPKWIPHVTRMGINKDGASPGAYAVLLLHSCQSASSPGLCDTPLTQILIKLSIHQHNI